jgi:hypothetical protein
LAKTTPKKRVLHPETTFLHRKTQINLFKLDEEKIKN